MSESPQDRHPGLEGFTPPPRKTWMGKKPPKGGCLTAFMIFTIIVNGWVAFLFLAQQQVAAEKMGVSSSWLIFFGLAAIINGLCALGILARRKIGAYGFAISGAALLLFFNINLFHPVLLIMGFLGVGFFFMWVRPLWPWFK